MKPSIILSLVLAACAALAAGGSTKLLVSDPLTGLPLYPATDSKLHLGNEPTRLPESSACKSKMQSDFYTVYESKVDVTLAWYEARLPGFKKIHAYTANRTLDTFYNAEGTLAVSVTGSAGKEGENADTYSVVYLLFQPALSEKSIVSFNQQKLICP
jgi:hypothetical protein